MRHSLARCTDLLKTGVITVKPILAGMAMLFITPLTIAATFDKFNSEDRMILDAQELRLDKRLDKHSHIQASDDLQLQFHAYGQKFLLKLQHNTRLLENVQGLVQSNVELYKGKVEGVDGSWARINRQNGVISGAVYDGRELFIIDESNIVSNDMAPWMQQQIASSQTSSMIYRLSDVVDSSTCGMDTSVYKTSDYQNLVSELQSSEILQSMAAANLQVNVAIIADREYVNSSSGDTDGQVLSQMNVVDGIFSEQVGVQFGIERITALSNNGPLTSTNPSTLLNAFRSYVSSNVGNPGLAHLFTGKNLNGNVIGIAYLSALCTRNGVGVTQAGGRGMTGALTAAHEFGHNFGAPHDNQGGSACASTPGRFLMNPSINGSDQFSQCSLNQIASRVARASCLVPAGPAPTPTPTPTPECVPGALDLRNVEAYSGNNTGSFNVSADGCSMTLQGNIWRITQTGVDINPETEVTFQFSASGNGEIQGIGFDEDNSASADRIFRLAGSQNWGIDNFRYTGNGAPQTFTVPVGEFYSGVNLGFVIANDKDSGSQSNSVTVSNVVLSDSQPPASCIQLNDVTPFSNTNTGTFGVSADQCSMTLDGNIWRATNETFDITPSTVVSFDFSANQTGEIHGIGFDENNTASASRIFNLTGSQNWGISDFRYSGGTQRIEIPVGQYYTGSSMRLILVNDKDSGTPNNRTVISNVRLSN